MTVAVPPTRRRVPPPPPADRKSAILAAALRVFTDKGLEASTIEDIRLRANASVGSIYHHFGNKEGIAAALYADALDDYWARLLAGAGAAATPREAIHALVATHMGWIVTRPEMARFLFARAQVLSPEHEQAVRQRTAGHFKALLALVKPWLASGALRRLPAELYGPLLMGPAQDLARQWLDGRLRGDPHAFVPALSDAAWRCLAAEPV